MNHHDRFIDSGVTETTPGVIAKVLQLLRGHPILQEAIAYDLADQAEKRNALADQIYLLRTENAKLLPVLEKTAASAYAEVLAVEPAYERVVSKWRKARDEFALAKGIRHSEEVRLLDQVEKLADPIIDETVVALREMWQRTLAVKVDVIEKNVIKNHALGTVTRQYLTTAPAIEIRARAILDAVNVALEMKRDVDQSSVRERLAKLIESIPIVEHVAVQVA